MMNIHVSTSDSVMVTQKVVSQVGELCQVYRVPPLTRFQLLKNVNETHDSIYCENDSENNSD
jgi:hypothetical protein